MMIWANAAIFVLAIYIGIQDGLLRARSKKYYEEEGFEYY